MTKIIGVMNEKGGCGKTTTSIGYFSCLISCGISAAYIDTDEGGKAAHILADNGAGWLSKHVHFCKTGDYQDLMDIIESIRDQNTQIIIIDTPAGVTKSFVTTGDISDVLIVPGKVASHDVSLTLKSAKALVKTKINKPIFIQPTEIEKGKIMDDAALVSYQDAANEFENLFCLPYIRKSAAILQGLNIGLSIFEYSPKAKVIVDYEQAIEVILETGLKQ